MNENKIDEEFIKYKFIALLHDPYWKIKNIERHESDIKTFLDMYGSALNINNTEKYFDKDIKKNPLKLADVLSSVMDRLFLSRKCNKEDKLKCNEEKSLHESIKSDYYMLYNIFSNNFLPEKYEKYVEAISESNNLYWIIFEKLKGDNLELMDKYIIFWTLFELKFIVSNDAGTPLPQDTRIPMFDILDHLYSTASLINLTYNYPKAREPKDILGYLVLVDIPGIQDFIARGRKLRDLSIGSWFISLVMYKFLEKLAEKYGPDVVITPTLRLNPFWINYVINRLNKLKNNKNNKSDNISKEKDDIYNNLDNIAKEIEDIYMNLEIYNKSWYKYPIIPGTALLLLPYFKEIPELSSEEKVKEYLLKIFKDNIKEIITNSRIIDTIKYLKNQVLNNPNNEDIYKQIFSREDIVDNLVHIFENIFIPKITVISVKKEDIPVEDDIILHITKDGKEIEYKFDKKIIFWIRLLKRLYEENRKNSLVRFDGKDLVIEKYMGSIIKDSYKNNKRLDICTNCGRYPSIIKIDYTFMKKDYTFMKEDKIKNLFKNNERLCPVCLFKRLLSYDDIYINILKKELDIPDNRITGLRFLSYDDLAIIYLIKMLALYVNNDQNLNKLKEIDNIVKNKMDELFKDLQDKYNININKDDVEKYIPKINVNEKEDLDENGDPLVEILKNDPRYKDILTVIKNSKNLIEFVYMYLGHDDIFERLEIKSKGNSSDTSNNEDILNKIYDVIERVKNAILNEIKNNIRDDYLITLLEKVFNYRYYSIILADGDDMGKLISGNLFSSFKYKIDNDIDNFYIKIIDKIIEKSLKDDESKKEAIRTSVKAYLSIPKKDTKIGNMNNETDPKKLFIDEETCKEEDIEKCEIIFLPSISYQVAISRSLMVSSLLEIKEILKIGGLPIYAGGDDLLVVCNKEFSADIINSTRKIFSGKENGWHKIHKNYLIQGLGFAGRTYVNIIMHYKDPLHVVLESLRDLEKKGKNKQKYFILYDENDRKKLIGYINSKDKKDIVFNKKNVSITLYTRNMDYIAVIPFYFDVNDNEFKDVKYPLYEYLKKISGINSDEEYVYTKLLDISKKIRRGRIYSVLSDYYSELTYSAVYNKEYFKKILKDVMKKGMGKREDSEDKETDRFAEIDKDIFIEDDKNEIRHIIRDIYYSLKLLL